MKALELENGGVISETLERSTTKFIVTVIMRLGHGQIAEDLAACLPAHRESCLPIGG